MKEIVHLKSFTGILVIRKWKTKLIGKDSKSFKIIPLNKLQ